MISKIQSDLIDWRIVVTFVRDKNRCRHMKLRGVITGDVVGSSKIIGESRDELLLSIRKIIDNCKEKDSLLRMEFYRGDSIQIISSHPETMAHLAVLLRSKIKSCSPQRNGLWDIRLSIGIGEVSYSSKKVATSDGEAFQLSGRNLDSIGKRRLTVTTIWDEVNEELEISTAFLDALITDWTKSQSEMIWNYFLNPEKTQAEIAQLLETSAQNVSGQLIKAKYKLVELYINRFQELIISHNSSKA